jgi:hypothetical protein
MVAKAVNQLQNNRTEGVVFFMPKMFANPHKDLTLSHLFVKLKLKEVKKLIGK